MNIRSLINQENLSPKQRAILVLWQNTKGNKPKYRRIQEYLDSYKPVFTESELDQMLHTDNPNEHIEYYLWTNIINTMLFTDMAAQRFYYDALFHLSILSYGIPYFALYTGKQTAWEDREYPLLNKQQVATYGETAGELAKLLYNFFMYTHTSILLNEFLDNCHVLESMRLLKGINTIDCNAINVYIKLSGGKVLELDTVLHFFHDTYQDHKNDMMADSEAHFRMLLKPLEEFDLYLPEKEKEILIQKTTDLMDDAAEDFSLAFRDR